jgi:hypothetical protein
MKPPQRRPSLAVITSLALVACTATLREPRADRQLWHRSGCFAHMVPEWRVLTLPALAGVARSAGTGVHDPLPGAAVYARRWTGVAVMETTTDAHGRFHLGVPPGDYEVAVCASGWNPWRGAVRVTGRPSQAVAEFPLELGQ